MLNLLKEHEGYQVDEKTQKRINTPLKHSDGLSEVKKEFLNKLLEQIKNGDINPHKIDSLYNKDVYGRLSEEDQEKADLTGHNILSLIRQIERLWELDHKESFQMDNLLESIYQMKSKFEDKYGDVYII